MKHVQAPFLQCKLGKHACELQEDLRPRRFVLTERLKGHYGNTKVGDFPVKTVCLRLRHVSSLLYQWHFAWFLQACNQPVGVMGD